MIRRMDLNADLGEGCANDAALMEVITSCNIACGGHAGDAITMRQALQLAKDYQVSAGAHPSFPDKENFGRTRSTLSGAALELELKKQLKLLKKEAAAIDTCLTHVKPHGALYNMAARDADLAKSVLTALLEILPGAALFGPPDSRLQDAAIKADVKFIPEGFADRVYEATGHLRDRKHEDALISTPEDQTQQALKMTLDQSVNAHSGEEIPLKPQTICVHGDSPSALAAAVEIRDALLAHGISVCAPH